MTSYGYFVRIHEFTYCCTIRVGICDCNYPYHCNDVLCIIIHIPTQMNNMAFVHHTFTRAPSGDHTHATTHHVHSYLNAYLRRMIETPRYNGNQFIFNLIELACCQKFSSLNIEVEGLSWSSVEIRYHLYD